MDIYDVIAMVEAWDLPRIMAGLDLEPSTSIPSSNPYTPLHF